jgi:hypothetical protein
MTGHEVVCLTSIEWRKNHPPCSCRANAGLDDLNGIGAGGQHLRGASTPIKRDRGQHFLELDAAEIAGGCGRLRGSCRRRRRGPPSVASAASAISGAAASMRTMRRRPYAAPSRSRSVILAPRVPPEPLLQSSLWRSCARSTKPSDSVALYPGLSVARSLTYFVLRSNCDKSSGQGKNRLPFSSRSQDV